MMKWLARLLAVGLSLLTVALAFLLLLASTEGGLNWSYRIAAMLSPGELTVAKLQGRLLGPLELRGVRYVDGGTQLDIGRIELDWSPGELLTATLHVRRFVLDDLVLVNTPPAEPEPDKPLALPKLSLPFYLRIDSAEVNRVRVSERGATTPKFELTRASIAADWQGDRGDIRQLIVDAPRYQLGAAGSLQAAGDYPLDLQLQWQVDSGGYGVWSGAGRLRGDMAALRIEQRVESPVAGTVEGTLSSLLDSPAWELDVAAAEFDLRSIRAEWPEVRIAGLLHTGGRLDDLSVTAGGTLRTVLPQATLNHKLDIEYHANTLTVRRLRSVYGDSATELRVSGRIAELNRTPRAELTGEWRQLQWPLRGEATVASAAGSFAVSGGIDSYHASLRGEVTGKSLPRSVWTVTGDGTKQHFTFSELRGDLLGGRLAASGELRWQPALEGVIAWQADGIDPGMQWPAWPGALHVTGSARGGLRDSGPDLVVEVPDIHGQLRGQTFSGATRLRVAGEFIELSQLELQADGNRVSAAGSLSDQWNVSWTAVVDRLAVLAADVEGSFRGSGRITGPRATPLFTTALSAEGLRTGDYAADHVDLVAALDTEGGVPSLVNLEATKLKLKDTLIDHLALRADGTTGEHRLQLRVAAAAGDLEAGAEGGYAAGRWSGSLTRLDLGARELGTWRLRQTSRVEAGGEAARLEDLCLINDGAELCASASWRGTEGWQARLGGRRLPLGLAQALLPENTVIEGELGLDAEAQADAAGLATGRFELRWGAGAIRQAQLGHNEGLDVAYRGGRLSASLDAEALKMDVRFEFERAGMIAGELRALRSGLPAPIGSGRSDDPATLGGRIDAGISDLSVLPLFVAAIENTKGRLDAGLQVTGSWNAPQLTGEVGLTGGAAYLPTLGITFDAITARLRSHDRNHISLIGSLRSGQGTLNVNGDARREPERGWVTQLTAAGERIEVMHTAEIDVIASPNLKLTMVGNRIDLTGEVVIPDANIRLRELSGAVSASEDVIIVSPEGSAAPKDHWQIYTQVRVRLGDFVRFNGLGLRAKLAGDMMLHEAPQQPTTASGELRVIGGEYRAYGQELTIERGRLLFFGGPVDNPGLDVRAVRKVEDITAGLLVRGTLKSPEVTIFSDPPMAETDALSYLVLGRPMSQATRAEGEQMYGAAAALGLLGGNLLSNQLGRRFGIDDVRIESGGGFGEGALVIRHYLSPRIYISYGMGLFESFNVFVVNYQISRLWALQAESGTQSSADLIYTIERK